MLVQIEVSQNLVIDLSSKLETTKASRVAATSKMLRDRETLETQVNELKLSLKNVEEVNSKKEAKCESLAAELSSVAASRDSLRTEKQALTSALNSKQTENGSLGNQVHDLVDEVMTLTSSQVKQYNEIRELTNILGASQSDMSQSKALAADLRSKLDTAEDVIDAANLKMTSLSKDHKRLESEVTDLNTLLKTSADAILQRKDDNQSLDASRND